MAITTSPSGRVGELSGAGELRSVGERDGVAPAKLDAALALSGLLFVQRPQHVGDELITVGVREHRDALADQRPLTRTKRSLHLGLCRRRSATGCR